MTSIQPIQGQRYVTAPNYNAVNISINNPEIKTQEPVEQKAPEHALYAYPQASIYEVPKQSIYVEPKKEEVAKVVETPLNVAPMVPPPVVIVQPTPAVAQPAVAQVVAQTPVIQAVQSVQENPKADSNLKTEAKPKTIDIKSAQKLDPKIDVNAFIAKLTSPDFEVQAKAMAGVARISQVAPVVTSELLDVKVFDALLSITNNDSSKLEGPTAQQIHAREKLLAGKPLTAQERVEADKTTPMELAERNKQYAMYTMAILQKQYGSEIEKTSNTVLPITELPGASTVVEQIKNNPNPMVRAAGIDALSFIQRPEYKTDLTTLFNVAKNDQDEIVREAAQVALKNLNALEQSPKAQTKTVA